MRLHPWCRYLAPAVVFLAVSCAPTGLRQVTIRVSSPYSPGRYEDHTAKPRERFPIMDTEYQGELGTFIADFAIDTTTMKAMSFSDTLRNVAVRVKVFQGDALVDSAWAFPVGRFKHISRTTKLIFEIVDFTAGKPYIPWVEPTGK